jgi:type IV secretory pathway VirB6-like protein
LLGIILLLINRIDGIQSKQYYTMELIIKWIEDYLALKNAKKIIIWDWFSTRKKLVKLEETINGSKNQDLFLRTSFKLFACNVLQSSRINNLKKVFILSYDGSD